MPFTYQIREIRPWKKGTKKGPPTDVQHEIELFVHGELRTFPATLALHELSMNGKGFYTYRITGGVIYQPVTDERGTIVEWKEFRCVWGETNGTARWGIYNGVEVNLSEGFSKSPPVVFDTPAPTSRRRR